LLPALTCGEISDPWRDVTAWAAVTTTAEAQERIHLLGLAGGRIPLEPGAPADRPAVITTPLGDRRPSGGPVTVVDLTSLWAGPLCAHLLGRTGARIIKVESPDRPDGARFGTPAFFAELHAGHELLSLNLRSDTDSLRALIAGADLVLEASRPRALAQLGIDAAEVVAGGTSWLSITARGRGSNTIGFGDDVAACAGMVVWEEDAVLPVGDALADPLTGVRAAVAALDALSSDEARLIDVSMLHVVAETLRR
jgi:crotonobetainyl-CoA:carnitine CoA-transferase CaiB-like acyl-CoA transferase